MKVYTVYKNLRRYKFKDLKRFPVSYLKSFRVSAFSMSIGNSLHVFSTKEIKAIFGRFKSNLRQSDRHSVIAGSMFTINNFEIVFKVFTDIVFNALKCKAAKFLSLKISESRDVYHKL